jgi:Acetyltransferase (GNAT) family
MSEFSSYSLLLVRGETLKGSPLGDKIIALDRKNMEEMLKAVGRNFPEDQRRITLFHPSNRMIVATKGQEVVGYADYCDDLTDPQDLYVSSIQIEASHRCGSLFKLLLSNLLIDLKSRKFRIIKTHIQKSNPRMIAIARKLGFAVEENPKSPSTLNVFAKREILYSPQVNRPFGSL